MSNKVEESGEGVGKGEEDLPGFVLALEKGTRVGGADGVEDSEERRSFVLAFGARVKSFVEHVVALRTLGVQLLDQLCELRSSRAAARLSRCFCR